MIYKIQNCEFGRGLFAANHLPVGTMIGCFYAITITKEQTEFMKNMVVADYWFDWPDGSSRLVLGDASFINHSFEPNLHRDWHDSGEYVTFYTIKPIQADEQLFFDYWNGDEPDVYPSWLKKET